ncbi:hypothetical protein Tco_0483967 [Tanacetum coccineum]
MARNLVSQTNQQECMEAENAKNKGKWEGNHNGSSSQQGKGHELPRAHTTCTINEKAHVKTLPLNQQTHTCFECGSLKHFKSKCSMVKLQKGVYKEIDTLAERQAEKKRILDNNHQAQQQLHKR